MKGKTQAMLAQEAEQMHEAFPPFVLTVRLLQTE